MNDTPVTSIKVDTVYMTYYSPLLSILNKSFDLTSPHPSATVSKVNGFVQFAVLTIEGTKSSQVKRGGQWTVPDIGVKGFMFGGVSS